MSKQIEALKLALEALEEIALAGMSVAPEMIDSKEAFHARQAWRFIGIAARAMEPVKKALAEQGCDYCNHPQYAGTKCKNCGREQPEQLSKPLLASDIVTMYDENPHSDSEMIAFARAIEAAHGITGEKK